MQRGLPVMSSSSALQSQNQSPPSHVVFQSLIPLELTVLGLTYIGKTLSPMETHRANVWAFLFSILIYWPTMGLMIARTFDGETCSQILSYVLFISGTFSCASLFSIFLPNSLGQFVLHASLPIILAVAALFYFHNKIEIAIGWVRDNLNSQTIANSFDWVLNKFNFARGWVQDNSNSQTITNSFDWVRNKFNSARGWVRDNFNSQTIANSFGWVQNKFNFTRGWVQDNLNSQTITYSFDLMRNKFNSARVWVRDNFNSQTIANSFGWVQNKFNSTRGWVQDNLNSQTITNSFDWVRNKFNSARGWVRENFNSQTIANSFEWVQNKFNSARGWVQMMQQQHPSSLPMTSSPV